MKTQLRHWCVPLAVVAICTLIALFGEAGRLSLRYLGPDAGGRAFGASYRWMTGHFTHIGWSHLALNLVGLISIWAMYGRALSARNWGVLLLICPVGISLSLSLFDPEIAYYVGLSGVLHCLLAAVAIASILSSSRAWEDAVVLVGLWAKITYEQIIGSVPLTAELSGGAVVVDAHLFGALIGTGYVAVLYGYKFINQKVCRQFNVPPSQ